MSKHLADYNSRPIEIVSGEGCFLVDNQGKKYLDFTAGWCVGNIGWRQTEVGEAIKREAEAGRYAPAFLRFANQEKFAKRLTAIAPNKKISRAFRCTSGSEAVEFAIKCARAATGKTKIVSIDGVYHGHTYGAAAVGDACRRMAPCAPGFVKLALPRNADEGRAVVRQFEKILAEFSDVAAFLSEPVWTNAGAIVPPSDFYPAIHKLCKKYGALLIMDEVATGFGRCGKLFASELWGVEPDIVCLGKGLTGGYATLGATLVTEDIFVKSRGIPAYSTFGWAPLDLAAAMANTEIILREKLWNNAQSVGDYLLKKLKVLETRSYVGEARGIGLLIGIEIVSDKISRTPDFARAVRMQNACAEAGLLIETAGNALFITPPLILSAELADQGAKILLAALG